MDYPFADAVACARSLRHVHDAPLDRLHHPFGREGEAPRAHAERVERIKARARAGEDAGAALGRVGGLAVGVERAYAVACFVICFHEVLGARSVIRG
eukprot:scaffold89939_cov37-Phaeocystis_antarctica.AAC.1